MDKLVKKALIAEAEKARANAYAPYSGFAVGAALLAGSGRIYPGCNVENGAYSPSICAERNAFARAVCDGEREFTAIAIVGGDAGDKAGAVSPCGVCRQVMAELCSADFIVIFADGSERSLSELLPFAFDLQAER